MLTYWINFLRSTKEMHYFCSLLIEIFVPLHSNMTPQEYTQLKAFARQDGVLLALLWIGGFACYILGLSNPMLGLAAMVLICAVDGSQIKLPHTAELKAYFGTSGKNLFRIFTKEKKGDIIKEKTGGEQNEESISERYNKRAI